MRCNVQFGYAPFAVTLVAVDRHWPWRQKQQHRCNSEKEVKTSKFFQSHDLKSHHNENEGVERANAVEQFELREVEKKWQNYNEMNRMRKFEIKNCTEFFSRHSRIPSFVRFV